MSRLHNVLDPVPRGRLQAVAGTGWLDTIGRAAIHWGIDLRPATKHVPGDPVYAPADARVALTGYGYGGKNAPIPWHSGRFVLLDLGEWGGDQMFCYFGHLASTRVHDGQRISAGHIIGTMGGSGATGEHDFGVHLHLGVAQNTTRPTSVIRNGQGWINPGRWFALHGVNLDTTPPATTTITPAATPRKDWSDMATKDEIKAAFREVLAEHRPGIDLTRTTAWRVKDGKQEATTASRVLQEVHGLAYEAARAAGATEAALREVLDRPRENENKED